jgi:hypothetical protein
MVVVAAAAGCRFDCANPEYRRRFREPCPGR